MCIIFIFIIFYFIFDLMGFWGFGAAIAWVGTNGWLFAVRRVDNAP